MARDPATLSPCTILSHRVCALTVPFISALFGAALVLAAPLPAGAAEGARDGAAEAADRTAAAPAADDDTMPASLHLALQEWTGDFDGMVDRGLIRVAIPVGLSTYYMDGADQAGATYDLVPYFEKQLRKSLGKKGRDLTVVVLPARLDQLLEMLEQGRADIVGGRLTITPERAAQVAFSDPFRDDVDELVISAAGTAAAKSLDDLVGLPLHVRRSSSFWDTLSHINEARSAADKEPLTVVEADERLRTEDLMELVGTGVIRATVVDSTVADLFAHFFPEATVHREAPLAEGQAYAWAFRKDDPKLAAAVNAFVKIAHKGTKLGNIVLGKYFNGTKWVENALAPDEKKKFTEMAGLFQQYADRYAFDWLMMTAQGYQESRLNQKLRSPVGAVGVMQVMPATARDPAVGIPDIHILENNIHAGVKYMAWLRGQHLDDPALEEAEKTYFGFAAYNAGPGNLSKARKRAARLKLDPNRWFDNVEIAMGQAVSREPVVYVRNILKYYTAYKLAEAEKAARAAAQADGDGQDPADAEARGPAGPDDDGTGSAAADGAADAD
ncbi:transglycosylase SLT domain-containing protein [Marinibaculum pumilum]|uniref:Transglycosylase SLT domain-containing protein n=1 Tax=Marinibaculum pumilum TaxID=1766165 RepID=A0ABV7L3N4_9PROT